MCEYTSNLNGTFSKGFPCMLSSETVGKRVNEIKNVVNSTDQKKV